MAMSNMEDGPGAILGLIIGGIILVAFGRTLESIDYVNLEFWGILYIIAGVVLGGVVVVAFIRAIMQGL